MLDLGDLQKRRPVRSTRSRMLTTQSEAFTRDGKLLAVIRPTTQIGRWRYGRFLSNG